MISMNNATQRAEIGRQSELNLFVRSKALIVDPDVNFLAFAAEALNSFRPGFEVTTTRNVEGAREWLCTFDPDLLLVGLDPTREGTKAFAEQLRTDPRGQHRRVLFLSGRVNGQSTAVRRIGECEAVLPKPTKLTDLLAVVRHYMKR